MIERCALGTAQVLASFLAEARFSVLAGAFFAAFFPRAAFVAAFLAAGLLSLVSATALRIAGILVVGFSPAFDLARVRKYAIIGVK